MIAAAALLALGIVTTALGAPSLTIIKSVLTGSATEKALPGTFMYYSIKVTNSGDAATDKDTIELVDHLDTTKVAYDAATGIGFSDTASGLSLGTVMFSETPSPGPYNYTIAVGDLTPDGNGVDDRITSIYIPLAGSFNAGGDFTITYRVRIK